MNFLRQQTKLKINIKLRENIYNKYLTKTSITLIIQKLLQIKIKNTKNMYTGKKWQCIHMQFTEDAQPH